MLLSSRTLQSVRSRNCSTIPGTTPLGARLGKREGWGVHCFLAFCAGGGGAIAAPPNAGVIRGGNIFSLDYQRKKRTIVLRSFGSFWSWGKNYPETHRHCFPSRVFGFLFIDFICLVGVSYSGINSRLNTCKLAKIARRKHVPPQSSKRPLQLSFFLCSSHRTILETLYLSIRRPVVSRVYHISLRFLPWISIAAWVRHSLPQFVDFHQVL